MANVHDCTITTIYSLCSYYTVNMKKVYNKNVTLSVANILFATTAGVVLL